MTPRRLIRWKSFWLGIFVLGFLGWSWFYSLSYSSKIVWGWRSNAFALVQTSGMVGLTTTDFGAGSILPSDEVNFWNEPMISSAQPLFPPAFRLEEGDREVAHWFLILLFLVPWSAFLAWRWQRQKKLSP